MIIFVSSWQVFAQAVPDSSSVSTSSSFGNKPGKATAKFDDASNTLKQRIKDKTAAVDTLNQKFQSQTVTLDSLKENMLPKPGKLNSGIASKLDSVDQATLGKIEAEVGNVNQKIDSLNHLQLPGGKYKHKVDSLYNGFQQKVLSKYKMPGDSISSKVKARVSEIDKFVDDRTSLLDSMFTANGMDINVTLRDKFKGTIPQQNLSAVNASGITDKLNLPTNGALPGVNAPDLQLPNASRPNTQVSNGVLPNASIPNTSNIPGLNDIQPIQQKVGDVTGVIKDAGAYADEIKNAGDVNHMKEIPEMAEKQLTKINDVAAAQSELAKAEALKEEMAEFGDQAKSPDEIKEEVKHRTQQPFEDYLKGHEEKVQAGMNKLFDFQKKYRTIYI